jgi:hypothetical protein
MPGGFLFALHKNANPISAQQYAAHLLSCAAMVWLSNAYRGGGHQKSEQQMDFTSLALQAVAGLVGGNAGGAVLKNSNLGGLGNTIAGALGGVGGGAFLPGLLGMVGDAGPSMIGNLVGGGLGGIVLQVIAGLVKNAMNKG